jgi:hypothetical protein
VPATRRLPGLVSASVVPNKASNHTFRAQRHKDCFLKVSQDVLLYHVVYIAQ